jgi:hypothetical protein
MTATKVWEYRATPDRYQETRCSVQRISNGNTLIDWSGGGGAPIASEITPEGTLVYEISFFENMRTYRSFRFDWEGVLQAPYLIAEAHTDKVSLIFNKFGENDVTGYIIYGGQVPESMAVIDTTTNTWVDLTDLENNKHYYFRVTALNSTGEESGLSNQEEVFVRYVAPGDNIILNGDFSENDNYWELVTSNGAIANSSIEGNEFHLIIDEAGTNYHDVQIKQEGLELIQGKRYIFKFDGYAVENRIIEAKVEKNQPPFDNYSKTAFTPLLMDMGHFVYEFEMGYVSDFNARVVFNTGGNNNDIYIDNVSLKEIELSGIQSESYKIPKAYNLFRNYPNPFNPKTVIRCAVPQRSYVKIEIFNILGQRVDELVNLPHNPGIHQIS